MTPTDEFASAVHASLAGSPFALTRTAKGFDVAIALADARWWGILSRSRLKDTFTFEVVCEEQGKRYSITDTQRRISWSAGPDGNLMPHFAMNFSYNSGRLMVRQRKVVIGGRDDGAVGKVVDIDFSSAPRRAAIREIARAQEWTERMGRNQRIGVGFAIGAGALVVVVLLLMLFFTVVLPRL